MNTVKPLGMAQIQFRIKLGATPGFKFKYLVYIVRGKMLAE